jgi:hypothetical protein
MGGGKAQPALQLVGYEDEVEAAVKYAFGNAFVCQVRAAQSLCRTAAHARAGCQDSNSTTVKLLVPELEGERDG